MRAAYTLAAIPQADRNTTEAGNGQVVPLPVGIPYTLADAEELAKRYNENPIYKGILRNHKYSHFIPFNLEALTMDPPPYFINGATNA